MTGPVVSVGTPDWLNPTPATAAPLHTGGYGGAGIASTTVGPFTAVGLALCALAWTPDQDSTLTFYNLDLNGNLTDPAFSHTVVAKAGSTAFVILPVLLGQVRCDIKTIALTAPCTGRISVAGYNGADRRDSIVGPLRIINQRAIAVAGNGQVKATSAFVLEGAAVLMGVSTVVPARIEITSLDSGGVEREVVQLPLTVANQPASAQLLVPAENTFMYLNNDNAAAATMTSVLIVGG